MDKPHFDPSRDSFESIYQAVGDDLERVPWAGLVPRAELVGWLDESRRPRPGTPALVIGCGLGDDAEELARRSFSVVAFDFSETAIALCAKRFPASTVRYVVADLFTLPPAWSRSFDLVVEVNTVQSLPPADHERGVTAIAEMVADGGALFVRCTGRDDDEPVEHRPWPLSRSELAGFTRAGLEQQSFVESGTPTRGRQFVATYRRGPQPTAGHAGGRGTGTGLEDTPVRTGV